MNKSIMSYIFRDYIRSYKYIVPILIFACFLLGIYAIRPNDVTYSYVISSAVIYMLAAWLTLGLLNTEDTVAQQVTILHCKSQTIYYVCKLLFVWIFTMILSVLAIIYPIIINTFDRQVNLTDIMLAIISHSLLSLLGIAVAAIFNQRFINDRRLSILALYMVIILSLIQGKLTEIIPFLKYPLFILPPVFYSLDRMGSTSNYSMVSSSGIPSVLASFAIILLYSLLLIFIYIKASRKKGY